MRVVGKSRSEKLTVVSDTMMEMVDKRGILGQYEQKKKKNPVGSLPDSVSLQLKKKNVKEIWMTISQKVEILRIF